jgi:hypothetical protein
LYCYLPYFRQWKTVSSHGDQLLAYPSFSGVLRAPPSSAACSFLVPCLLFSFVLFVCLWSRESVCPGAYAGISQEWLWEYHMPLVCSPVGLLDVSQAGLEPASGGPGALLFSQCNVVQAGVSGCGSPGSSWCFFSAKYGSSVSAKFLIYGAHAVCFCILVTILNPPPRIFFFLIIH